MKVLNENKLKFKIYKKFKNMFINISMKYKPVVILLSLFNLAFRNRS